jgi:hypothetical protein
MLLYEPENTFDFVPHKSVTEKLSDLVKNMAWGFHRSRQSRKVE